MANYDIEARVRLVAGQALKGIKDLQDAAKEAQKAVAGIEGTKFDALRKKTEGFRKGLDGLHKAAKRLDALGKVSGLVALTAGLNAFGEQLANATAQTTVFGKTFETGIPVINQLGSAVESLTHFMAPLVHQMQALGAQGQTVAAGLGLAVTAAVAFGPHLSGLGTATKSLAGFFGQLRHKLLDFVEGSKTAIQFTGSYRDLIRSVTDNVANLTTRQQNARRALNGLNSTSEEAIQVATTLVSLNNRLNRELANQETLLKNAANAQRQFNDQAKVRANVAQSSFARQGSGFAAFSQAADVIPDAAAIDKSIRRYRDRIAKAFKGMQPVEFPLALPSSEMLKASERGIQQLSSFYGDLNTEIDTGVQSARQFTEQLKTQATRAQGLPPIFYDLGRALEATVATTNNVFSNNEKTKKTVVDIDKLYGDTLKKTNAQVEAQEQLGAIITKQNKLLEKRDQMMSGAVSGAVTGGAFPLLFGQGAGASLGGALGGGVGGALGGQLGMGLSLVGTAVGGFFDRIGQKAAELGQALDPLSPDIDKIIESTGLLGTQTAAYIKELEDAEDSTLALVAATYELKRIVGKDGVDTLKEFGDVTQDLGNEFQKMMTLAGTALADFLDGPLKSLVQYLEGQNLVSAAAKSEDPKLTKLAEQYSDIFVPSSMKDFPIFADAVKQQQEILNEIRTIQNELAEKEKEKLDTLKETSTARQVDVNLLQAQIDLAKTDGDLTNEAVFNLREKVIEQQTYVRLQDAANNQAKIDIALMQEKLDKQILINQKKEEEARKAERAAREAERLRKRQEEDKRRLNVLLEQTKLAETLLILDRQIATEKMEGNEVTVQALEQEKVLEQLASKITEIKARGLSYDRERLEIILAQIAADKELVAASTQRQDQQKQLTESFTKTLQGLDFQLEKTTAISGSQEDMLRLKELELNYREKGKTLSVDEKAAALDKITKIREATEALAEQEVVQQRINAIVNTAGQQFAGLFETLIKGTNDWNAAISNVLNSLANALIRFGLTALGGTDGVGLFSILSGTFTGGKKALGGQVSPGKTYMVGEKGPELFAPGAKGNIIPNDAMGGSNIVVNVDAGGSNVQGDGNQAKALGAAIGLAVQNEILKQKKPGGLLY